MAALLQKSSAGESVDLVVLEEACLEPDPSRELCLPIETFGGGGGPFDGESVLGYDGSLLRGLTEGCASDL